MLVVVTGNKIAPRLGGWYLGRKGFDSQQFDGARPDRPDNLWQPVDADRDFGAHGVFDRRSHRRSPELWIAKHKALVAGVGVGVAVVALWKGLAS